MFTEVKMATIKKVFKQIFTEGGVYSFTRILIALGYVLFIGVTLYLVAKGRSWQHYDTFALLTAGASGALQGVNKFINSKFNTTLGEIGKPQ